MFISKKTFTKIIELGKSLWKALRTEKVSFRKASLLKISLLLVFAEYSKIYKYDIILK